MRFILSAVVLLSIVTANHCRAQSYERELARVAEGLATSIREAGIENIAVTDFTDLQGDTTELGRFVAEELSTNLVIASKSFSVVDRNNFRFILAEQKLTLSGLVNPANTKKLGQMAGVDGLVAGSITPLGEAIRISARVLATDTAKVVAATAGTITTTGAISQLLAKQITSTAGPNGHLRGTGVKADDASLQAQGANQRTQRSRIVDEGKIKVTFKSLWHDKADRGLWRMLLMLENLTEERVTLSCNNSGTDLRQTFLVDDRGRQAYIRRDAYLILSPRQRLPITLEFGAEELSGVLSAAVIMQDRDSKSRFSFTFEQLQPLQEG